MTPDRVYLVPLIAALAAPFHAQRTPLVPETRSEARAPAGDTFPVEVLLHVQHGSKDDAPPASGIRVELGITASEKSPSALPLYLHEPVLASAVSDASGRIQTTVAVPAEWKERSALMWARVETPGHQRRAIRFDLDRRNGPERIFVYPGGTLLGRATNENGEPVNKAPVWLVREKDGKHEVRSWSETLANGTFELDFSEAGRFGVHVRSALLGSTPRNEVVLDPARRPDELELVVRGGEVLCGRLVDPSGAPVPGAWVSAVPRRLSKLTEVACFEAEQAGGLLGGCAQSDVEGRFRLPALLPGTYRFHARYWGSGSRDLLGVETGRLGAKLATHTIERGEPELELVFPQHRIEVQVTNADGEPAQAFTLDGRGDVKDEFLAATPVEERPGDFLPPFPVQIGDRYVLEVEPEREYLLSWQENGVPYVEKRVLVDRFPHRYPVELRLGERGAPPVLDIHVLDPEGNEFIEPWITVFSAASGREVRSSIEVGLPSHNMVDGSTWSIELPPGRFRVRASAEPFQGCVIRHPLPRTAFLPAEVAVETRAGERVPVELRLGSAGHLDFEASSPGAGPRAADRALFYRKGSSSYLQPERAREPLGGGHLVLVSGERRYPLERFEVPNAPHWELGWLVPGWPARCLDPIPPGEWTLRVEDESSFLWMSRVRVLFERSVRIEAGQATTVRW